MKTPSVRPGGFTLTENLMAMTIIVMVAIPLTGMLGMASSARTSADHRRESANIARQIAAELAHSTAELGAPQTQWYPLIAVHPVTGRPDDWPYLRSFPADLDGHSVHLLYDAGLRPAGEVSGSIYEAGLDGGVPQADEDSLPLFAVRLAFEKVPAHGGPAQTFRATVSVGSPAQAPAKSRRVETFTTLIHVPDRTTGS